MNEPSLAELLPRLVGSMAVVIMIMAIAARLLKGRHIPGTGGMRLGATVQRKTNPVEVVSRQGLGRHGALTVIRAGNELLVLGVTDQNISVLTRIEDSETEEGTVGTPDIHGTDITVDDVLNAPSGQAWTGLLSQVRERTVRRT